MGDQKWHQGQPEKFKAIAEMRSPKTLKEVQTLNGRLVALNRFLSKIDEKSLPMLNSLNMCIMKNHFSYLEVETTPM